MLTIHARRIILLNLPRDSSWLESSENSLELGRREKARWGTPFPCTHMSPAVPSEALLTQLIENPPQPRGNIETRFERAITVEEDSDICLESLHAVATRIRIVSSDGNIFSG